MNMFSVMPAEAGIQNSLILLMCIFWTPAPAFAGVTTLRRGDDEFLHSLQPKHDHFKTVSSKAASNTLKVHFFRVPDRGSVNPSPLGDG